jgi:sensor domain CHASE-containing protein
VSLRSKVLLFVATVSLSFIAITWIVQESVMRPQFALLEQREADEDLRRCHEALRRDLEFLSRSAVDYAAWDDTWHYTTEPNEEYETSNLVPVTFDNLDIDYLAIVREDGSPVWERRLGDDATLASALEVAQAIARSPSLGLGSAAPGTKAHAIVATPLGPMLVGAAAITTTDRQAPVRGTLWMGRFVDAEVIAGLADRTGIALALHPVDAVPAEDLRALDHLATAEETWRDASDPDRLRSYQLVAGGGETPILLLRTEMPRVVMARAHDAALGAALTSVGAAVLVSIVTWWVLAHMIVAPLTRLTRHAVRVGAEGNLNARLGLTGRDEVSVLAREFDAMVEKLATSQAQLVGLAQGAGRAEIATNVLHNVGNVLNSASVAAGLISQTLGRSEVDSLRLAADLIQQKRAELGEFFTGDPRGRALPDFLSELATHLRSEHETLEGETKTLCTSLEHIRQVVQAQNEYSRARPLLEPTDPASIVDQALALSSDSFLRHRIEVERKVETVGLVPLDRHRVLQILTNLLTNAKHAVKAAGHERPRIGIELTRIAMPEGAQVHFRVTDNGVGIPAENLARIFAFGFSTRPDGQGVGLHSAINQAREMGGDLAAESAGPGQGAAFTLSIPLSKSKESA